MNPLAQALGFLHWIGVSHYLNLLLVGFMARSGLEILAIFWMLNGWIYVVLLFGTGEWRRLVPTSWGVLPQAASDAGTYLHFHAPLAGHPYNALQQLTYAGVVFVLAPILMLTGAAMSPAIAARYPWYLRLFGGRQPARSIHFLSLLAIVGFTIVHVLLVAVEDFPRNMAWIILGDGQGGFREDTQFYGQEAGI